MKKIMTEAQVKGLSRINREGNLKAVVINNKIEFYRADTGVLLLRIEREEAHELIGSYK